MQITINNSIRELLALGLGEVPEVGFLIEGLVRILWPESDDGEPKEDVWREIKQQVEEVVEQKLDAEVYNRLSARLDGLKNVLKDYSDAVKDSKDNVDYITQKYNIAIGEFEAAEPQFREQGSEILLLPLFAPMATLYLSLIRDGIINGQAWGFTPQVIADKNSQLTENIADYTKYIQKWITTGVKQAADKVPDPDPSLKRSPDPAENARWLDSKHYITLKWAAINKFQRHMQLTAADIVFYWPYMKLGAGSPPKLTREIYSDPIGFTEDESIVVNTPRTKPLTGLAIWAGDQINAVQQSFGGGSLGSRQGESGGTNKPPKGWQGEIKPEFPVVSVIAEAMEPLQPNQYQYPEQCPNALQLVFAAGEDLDTGAPFFTTSNNCGEPSMGNPDKGAGWGKPKTIGFDGHIVSQMHVVGRSSRFGTIACLILGFRIIDSYSDSPVKISSPAEAEVIRDLPYEGTAGTISGPTEKLWTLISQGEDYYLQYPPPKLGSDRVHWTQSNIRFGNPGTWSLHIINADDKASAWFENRARTKQWGAFTQLPYGATIVDSVTIEKR